MATTAIKPRSARAAASEAASVSRATAARKKASGNASGERAAKQAQARRRASAAEASSNGSQASNNGRSTAGRSSGQTKSTGQAKSNGSGSGSSRSSGSTSASSKSRPQASTSRTKTAASKPKAAAPKPKGSASKPKAAAPKPKGSASKSKAGAAKPNAGASKPSGQKSGGSSRSVASKRPSRSNGEGNHDNGKDGGNPVTSGGKHLASALFSSTSHRPKKHPIARAAAKKGLKAVGRRSLSAGGEAIRSAAESAGTLGRQAMRAGMSRMVDKRPPVQASVDVAAPISVVWSEWMTFEWFTEGLHNIESVERDGDELVGRVVAPHERDWHAEVVDEREQEAFAWRSDDGTDCAGLVTFHRLSDRLTRVEADLDVLPTNPGETFLLSLPIPTRRAERELQRFKAHVEFINPDTYEEEDSDESDSEQQDDARAESGGDAQTQDNNDGDREDAENDD